MARPPRLRILQRDNVGVTALAMTHVTPAADPDVCTTGASMWNSCSEATLTIATRERDLGDVDNDNGGDGPYSNSQDMMAILFRCADATTLQINVSSPRADCFEADTETVRNSGDSPVVGLVAWMLEYGANKAGARCTAFLKGWRWRAKVV